MLGTCHYLLGGGPLSFKEVGSKIVTLPQIGAQQIVTLPQIRVQKIVTLPFERTPKKWNGFAETIVCDSLYFCFSSFVCFLLRYWWLQHHETTVLNASNVGDLENFNFKSSEITRNAVQNCQTRRKVVNWKTPVIKGAKPLWLWNWSWYYKTDNWVATETIKL